MIIFIWPIIMMLLYGYAITFDIKEIKLGLLDNDRSHASRELVEKMTCSNYIHISARFSTHKEIEEAVLSRKILAALIIPEKFGKKIKTQNQIELQIVIDGSNANSATVAISYIKSFFVSYSLEINKLLITQPIQLHPRVWYNPDLKSAHFIVPGLVAVIMMMICALLTSVTITRERETGTLEQILVSPIKASEIVFGKYIPYVLLSIMDAVIIIGFARLIFKVPFRGNPILLLLLSIVYVYAAASLGVFISTRVKTQLLLLRCFLPFSFRDSFSRSIRCQFSYRRLHIWSRLGIFLS
jgi:ABC-2 type transport system permease protein